MRLEKIKLTGFKSFVDPTTVEFPSNLVGVVGPNGCGKSNVIDAVRWVMGESSAKNLRGESITDVIFNGTTSRKPVGQASIELIFDNREGKLGGEYAKYAEISIKRVVNREAQSTYFLNGTKCRRRDITDVFLGTGLGPRSYSIIEQGMISKLIEAKPEDLRNHLEEVSGISKYKERRRETETRIRHTKENLARLSDLREELDKQLQHLQRQSASAERFKVLKEQERLLRAQTQVLRFQALDQQVQSGSLKLQEQETALEALVARQQHIDTRITELREAEHDIAERHSTVQGQYYQMGSEITRLEQSMEHFKERHHQLRDDLEQAEQNWHDLKQHARDDKERLAELEASLLDLEPHLMLAREKAADIEGRLLEAQQAMREWQLEWDAFNQRAAASSQTAQVEQARIQQIEQRQSTGIKRLEAISTEQSQLSTERLEEEVALFEVTQEEAQGLVEETRVRLQETVETINAARNQQHASQQDLDKVRNDLRTLAGRQASLQALQQEALGKKENGLNQWLTSQGLDSAPRLAERMRVNPGFEVAVEAVLSTHLDSICVKDFSGLRAALASLPDGHIAILAEAQSLSTEVQSTKVGLPLLASEVSGFDGLAHLLQGIFIADDVNQALNHVGSLMPNESIVTKNGVWLTESWVRVNKSQDATAGILRREQELRAIDLELKELELKEQALEEVLLTAHETLSQAEIRRDEVQHDLNQATAKLADIKAELSVRRSRLEQLTQRKARLQGEAQELEQQLSEAHEELLLARATWQKAMTEMEQDANLREELLMKKDACRESLEGAQRTFSEEKDALHRLEITHQTSQSQINQLKQNLARIDQQDQQLQVRCEQLHEALSVGDAPLEEMRMELETCLQKRVVIEQELSEVKRSLDESQHQVRTFAIERSELDQQISAVRDRLEEHRLQAQEMKVRCHTLQEQLTEAGFVVEEVLATLPSDLNEMRAQQELEQTQQRIQRLGPINLAAIEEYQTQSERKTYLDSQNTDLEEALNTLENAIRKIDKETRDRFKETFDIVNGHFQSYFPKVFGGGSASLELTSEDLLEAGVTVMARPPGKKNSTIHLLSGGEKALTAVALVFSLFQLNPAPFCMLDEVDAPLDDANVGRYCRLVKEMSDKVQFIFITHNKVAMEMAKHLTGVTMHEPGVSRIVSVDVEEAAALAEA